ncbi:MAG: hypothetical protein RJA99_3351 [Pseudomonadota bacterium]|jgi:biopolymer transport protein ExbB
MNRCPISFAAELPAFLVRRFVAVAVAALSTAPLRAFAEGSPTAVRIVENPYGFAALWSQGDFVAKGTLIILLLMSMGTWYVIVSKLMEQSKLNSHAHAVSESFWKSKSLADGVSKLDEASPFRYVADAGIGASQHHEDALTTQIDLNTWITLSVQRAIHTVQNRLQDGLAVLATVGSTAPFVGLFGTVWGIYHALTAIGVAGQASIDKVAGPVGEALIMTAIGLAVAVPAVLGYNWLVRRNKAAMEQVRAFGDNLHLALLRQAANRAA